MQKSGYLVTAASIGCGMCLEVCPRKCIDVSGRPLKIQHEHCLHCGNCYRECTADAVVKLGG